MKRTLYKIFLKISNTTGDVRVLLVLVWEVLETVIMLVQFCLL